MLYRNEMIQATAFVGMLAFCTWLTFAIADLI